LAVGPENRKAMLGVEAGFATDCNSGVKEKRIIFVSKIVSKLGSLRFAGSARWCCGDDNVIR
jgi:hypothetical protein